MADIPGVAPQQRKLRLELRHARVRMGQSQRQVADALEWSLSKIVRIEQGAVGVSITDLRALLHHYEVSDKAYVEELLELARKRTEGRWWDKINKTVSPTLVQIMELEEATTMLRQFQGQVIPGLLQTADAARRVISKYTTEESEIDEWVQIRVGRQRILDDPNKEFVYVFDEAVLHRRLADPDIMAAQYQHLLKMNERPNISMSVIPFTHGTHQAMQGSFAIYDTPVGYDDDQVDSTIVIQNPIRETLIRRDANRINEYIEAFAQLEHMSVPLTDWEGWGTLI
ncbi:helix-turn-helix domain-containing protein [Actinokineospora inagensis]|uniref:helix-turn-helix domain-containing protein n=1 Tax=Actinokineospora inagensis TaxID=103730 RepID=UPI00041155B5|nr:helix-turn-helix transcriptional regulator [Actinokineospora inagensis]